MTAEATPSDSRVTDAAPLYEEVVEGQGCMPVVSAGVYFTGAVFWFAFALQFWEGVPASLLVACPWVAGGLLALWEFRRGCWLTIRADGDGLTVIRGRHVGKPLWAPYTALTRVQTTPARRWWWIWIHDLSGSRYFPCGRKPASAVRILMKVDAATRTPRVITIGTDNAEELADFLRERIESE